VSDPSRDERGVEHHIEVPRTARYLTLGPGDAADVWIVIHGYGQLAGRFLRRFEPIDDGTRHIVAPEALSRFYVGNEAGRHGQSSKVGATWMTREAREDEITDYVNSMWELQDEPFSGDTVNAYNDGPPEPGAAPLGPFYELETSSPALALEPGKSGEHVSETYHFQGERAELDRVLPDRGHVHRRNRRGQEPGAEHRDRQEKDAAHAIEDALRLLLRLGVATDVHWGSRVSAGEAAVPKPPRARSD